MANCPRCGIGLNLGPLASMMAGGARVVGTAVCSGCKHKFDISEVLDGRKPTNRRPDAKAPWHLLAWTVGAAALVLVAFFLVFWFRRTAPPLSRPAAGAPADPVVFSPQNGQVAYMAFSPDGRHLLCGDSVLVVYRDATTGQPVDSVPSQWATRAAFSHDGKRVVFTDGKTLFRWLPNSGAGAGGVGLSTIAGIGFLGDEILCAESDAIRIMDENGNERRRVVLSHFGRHLVRVVFSPSGRRAVTLGMLQQEPPVGGVAVGPTLRLWDVEKGEVLRRFDYLDALASFAVSDDATRVVSVGIKGRVDVWDATQGKVIKGLLPDGPANLGPALDAVLTPDGRRAVVSLGTVAQLWDIESGKEVKSFAAGKSGISSMACSPDGRRLATGHRDGSVRVWRLP